MDNPASAVPPVDRPVFVLGERQAAMELIRALGDTATVCALPLSRLLPDLVSAVERAAPATEPLAVMGQGSPILPASWYREVQAGWLRFTGKTRTVEFSALSVLRLCHLFPTAQFVVVHQLRRAIPRSRRLPTLGRDRIIEVDSGRVTDPQTVERVLAFLHEPVEQVEPAELELSDARMATARSVPHV